MYVSVHALLDGMSLSVERFAITKIYYREVLRVKPLSVTLLCECRAIFRKTRQK